MKKALKKSLSLLLAIAIILGSAFIGLNEIDFGSVFAIKTKAVNDYCENEGHFYYNSDSCLYCGEMCLWNYYYYEHNYEYNYDAIEISGYRGNGSDVVIPDKIDGLPVVAIRDYTFSESTNIKSITISDSIVYLGYHSFYNCTSLVSVEISDSVTNIGKETFYGCSNLKYVTIGNSVTSIGDYAFYDCTSLESITLPDSVVSIGVGAFENCENVTRLTIGSGLASVGDSAFLRTSKIKEINVSESNPYYSSLDGVWFNKDKTILIRYPCEKEGNTYTIPDSVRTIAPSSFRFAIKLRDIILGDGVTNIDEYAFYMCYNLESIILSPNVISIGYAAFCECTKLVSITIPDTVTNIADYAFLNCTSLTDVYYGGTEADWENITIGLNNNSLPFATIHYHEHTCIDWVIDKAPTCTEAGTKYSECSECGEAVMEENDALGHSFSEEWTIDKEPTYTENGSKSRHCLNCDAKTDVTVILADFDNVMYVAQEGGTCNGKISYVVYLKAGTSVNGAIVNVEFDDEALEVSAGGAYTVSDSYGDLIPKFSGIYESGLRYDATNVYSMAYINTRSETLSKDTPFMKITFDINNGYTEASVKFTCKEFNSNNPEHNVPNTETPVLIFEETADIAVSEHGSSDWIVDEAATVFDDGSAHRECITCGEILETKIIPQLVCQEPELKSVVQNVNGLVLNWNAVEGADVYNIYRKTDSGEWFLWAAIESDAITYVDVNVEKDKVYYYTVQAINEAGASSYNSDGLGCEFHVHSFGDWIITTPATCIMVGERYRVCSGCGDEELEVIDSLGHDYSTEWTIDLEPTCTEDGSKSHHCSRCESVKDVTVIETSGHSYGDWVITKTPTCTEQGSLSKTCSVCGDVKTEAISKNPHSYSTEWTIDLEPTCTEKGSKSHHCTVCGDKADVTVIEAYGHSYGDWFTSTEPTCTEDGSKYKICSVCGDVVTEAIGSVGHKYSTEWTIDIAPTCTEDGSKSHHCTACGDKADVTVIKATGHNYEVNDIVEAHPHTVAYQCSYCYETKTEKSNVSDCLECNFTITYVKETNSYKVVSYTGSQEDVVIPATYNGCAVTTIANGCFKGNTSITSVKIADGVTSIGSLAFMNCSSLEKVTIPASVTSIGTQAFYGFTGTIYCTRDSVAHEYAIANSIDYVLLSILETENTKIDYDNFLIFTDIQSSNDIFEILGVSETAIAIPMASVVHGGLEIYGTGTVITVFDGDDYIGDFTLIVEGDLNGDATCDVIDASVAYLYSVDMDEASEVEILAANGCTSDELDANSYQNVVNMCLAS